MNCKNFKRLRLLGIPFLAAAAVFSSCMTELDSNTLTPGGENGADEQEVLLKLNVPGAAKPGEKSGTRAVNADEEEEIDDLYVLAFKAETDESQDSYAYYVPAKKGADNATWTALLKVKDYDQRFIVIANAQGANGNLVHAINALKPGEKTKAQIKELLKVTLTDTEKTNGFNATGTNDHSAFTMCGQTAATKITAGGNIDLQVNLYRIMGRIQVYFGDKQGTGVGNFTPTTVRLYNFNDKAQVIPAELGGKVSQTTVPADAVLQKGEASYQVVGNKLEYSVYLFETAQPDAADADKHTKRPCLVVGGKYNGGTADKYYRVDLGTPKAGTGNTELDYLDVLRNHSYEITVTSVSGEGHDTEQDALESKAANMTATVIRWDETEIGNIDFDGEKFLGIGTMEYSVERMGSENLMQKVSASTGLAWTATLLNEDGQGTPDWVRFKLAEGTTAAETSGTGAGVNSPADVAFTVDGKTAAGERVAIMRFKAAHLEVDAKVIQTNDNRVFIEVPDELIVFDGEADNTQMLDITFGPENTILTWELVDGDTPITFTTTPTIDGSADGTTGISSDAAGSKVATASFAAQAIPETGTRTMTLRLIAKNRNGDIAARIVKLSQIKLGVSLAKTWFITDGNEQKLYVDANFDWEVTMDNPGDVEGTLIEPFTQNQTGVANVGAASDQSVITFKTIRSDQFDTAEKEVHLTFRDRTTGAEFKRTIKIAKGYFYDGKIYHILYGGEKTFKQILAEDRTLSDGTSVAPEGYTYNSLGLGLALSQQVQQELWHSGTGFTPSTVDKGNSKTVTYDGQPFYCAYGTYNNTTMTVKSIASYCATDGMEQSADIVTTSFKITKTGTDAYNNLWYPVILIADKKVTLASGKLTMERGDMFIGACITLDQPYIAAATEFQTATGIFAAKTFPKVKPGVSTSLSIRNTMWQRYSNTEVGAPVQYSCFYTVNNDEYLNKYAYKLDITGGDFNDATKHVYFVKEIVSN